MPKGSLLILTVYEESTTIGILLDARVRSARAQVMVRF